MILDAHQHFWRLDRGDYTWLTPELTRLYRDFSPADLEPLLRAAGVERGIVVQAAASVAETEFLLSVAREHAFVAGVVGWAPLDHADAPDVIARLATQEKLVGLRPMIQDIPDERWMLGAEVGTGLRALHTARLRFDALVKPPHLPHLRTLVERHPELRVVIDHAAKPVVAAGTGWKGFREWAGHLRTLAQNENVFCKLSGLATEAGADWSAEDLRPFADVVLEAFGARRVMWGSDWPVLLLAGNYEGWLKTARTLTGALAPAERDLVFGGSAAAFYGIDVT